MKSSLIKLGTIQGFDAFKANPDQEILDYLLNYSGDDPRLRCCAAWAFLYLKQGDKVKSVLRGIQTDLAHVYRVQAAHATKDYDLAIELLNQKSSSSDVEADVLLQYWLAWKKLLEAGERKSLSILYQAYGMAKHPMPYFANVIVDTINAGHERCNLPPFLESDFSGNTRQQRHKIHVEFRAQIMNEKLRPLLRDDLPDIKRKVIKGILALQAKQYSSAISHIVDLPLYGDYAVYIALLRLELNFRESEASLDTAECLDVFTATLEDEDEYAGLARVSAACFPMAYEYIRENLDVHLPDLVWWIKKVGRRCVLQQESQIIRGIPKDVYFLLSEYGNVEGLSKDSKSVFRRIMKKHDLKLWMLLLE